MRRRSFLKGVGVVTVAVAGGAVWRACDRGVFSAADGPAYEPWKDWRSAEKGPLSLVSAAILAASAVNSQPWLFKVTDSSIELHVDARRNIGAFDPFYRELHISLGCALENLMLAAAANGYAAKATLTSGNLGTPSNDLGPQLVARVELAPGKVEQNELYDAIPHRHTNRAAFDRQRPILPEFADALLRVADGEPTAKVFVFTAEPVREKIVGMMSEAAATLSGHPEIGSAIAPWMRTDQASIQRFRDGMTYGTFGEPPSVVALEKFLPPTLLRKVSPPPPKDAYAQLLRSARLFGLIAVQDRYDKADSLRAGRIWQRAHLLATARGLAARPVNQGVQLIDQERAWSKDTRELGVLADLTGDAAWQPTFMFYMGYPTRPAVASPRRTVGDVLL